MKSAILESTHITSTKFNTRFITKPLSMLRIRFLALSLGLLFASVATLAQSPLDTYAPFDPANTQTRIVTDFDSYYFSGGHRFYSMRFGYDYGIPNNRHRMGIAIPVVHCIFNGDFAGFENTTGIGDIRFTYVGVPYLSKDPLGLQKVAASMEVTTPTGNYRLGRGVGSWVFRPGLTLSYQLDMDWYLFPQVRFQFSTTEVNSRAGADGLPDLNDPQKDEQLQNINLTIPTYYMLRDWQGWIGLTVDTDFTFVEDTYFLFVKTEVGKMLTPKTSALLQITQFVAGQPRLNTVFSAHINFFLR